MSKSSKLHELLAVKPTRESEADSLLKDHTAKFKGELHLFQKTKTVFEPAAETEGSTAKSVVEEDTTLVTTVKRELDFVLDKFTECVDLLFTIDVANASAIADIVLADGSVLAKDVPATFLVHLEKRLNQVLAMAQTMATADPAAGFALDASMGANVLQALPIVRKRTAKVEEYITIAQATDKHPAQVAKITKDVITGTLTTSKWSALPTVHQKSEMIKRIVAVKEAVIQARARANCYEAQQRKIFGGMVAYFAEPLN